MNKKTAEPIALSGQTHELNAELRQAMGCFSGKWKLEILWLLNQRTHRFNELRRAVGKVTQHTLSQQLQELERDGMIVRTAYPEIPPRVEYMISAKAKGLQPVFSEIFTWANSHRS